MISIYQTQHAVPLLSPRQCVKSSLGVDPKVYKEVSGLLASGMTPVSNRSKRNANGMSFFMTMLYVQIP